MCTGKSCPLSIEVVIISYRGYEQHQAPIPHFILIRQRFSARLVSRTIASKNLIIVRIGVGAVVVSRGLIALLMALLDHLLVLHEAASLLHELAHGRVLGLLVVAILVRVRGFVAEAAMISAKDNTARTSQQLPGATGRPGSIFVLS